MCLSRQKQSPQGRLSICNALLSDRAYKKQCPYDHRKPLMDQRSFMTISANDFHYFEQINALVQHEPIDALDPEIMGCQPSGNACAIELRNRLFNTSPYGPG